MSPPGRDRRTMTDQEELDSRGDVNTFAPFEDTPRTGGDFHIMQSPRRRPPIHRSRGRRHGAPGQAPPTPAVPSPFVRPSLWDTIVIGGVLFLGLASIEGETETKVESKKHNGRDGGRITDKGAVAGEFTITFRMWNEETWASWDQVFVTINPQRPVEHRAPLDVSHPAFAQRNITRVYVKSVSLPKRETSNEWQVTAKVIQWLPSSADPRGQSVTRTRTAPDTLANTTTAFSGLTSSTGGETIDEGVPDPVDTETGPL